MSYDVIGDIHGYAGPLKALLATMGYECRDGVYRHPSRTAIFVGDFIDRGPEQREVIGLVRAMVAAGSARAVMGNHEFNAIAYRTPYTETGDFLRPHTRKNRLQHEAFLAAYEHDPAACAEVIDWFKQLPLWADLGRLRVIHACWDTRWIERIRAACPDAPKVPGGFLFDAARRGTWQYEALETLLKGKEVALPGGHVYHDKEGTPRRHIRVRWWDAGVSTYREAYMGPEAGRTHIPDDDIQGGHLIEYAHGEPPVLLGHYWLEGRPLPLATNIACVDYSIAQPGGKLAAYRWAGEAALTAAHFVWVEREA